MERVKTLLIIIVLLVCIGCIAYAVAQAFLPEDEPAPPSLSQIMNHSGKTTVEKKNADGSVSKITVNGDPVFRGFFSDQDLVELAPDLYDSSTWLYRVTYYTNEESQAVFYFGPIWLALDGKVYTMSYLNEICASLNGLWDYWTAYLEVHQGEV